MGSLDLGFRTEVNGRGFGMLDFFDFGIEMKFILPTGLSLLMELIDNLPILLIYIMVTIT